MKIDIRLADAFDNTVEEHEDMEQGEALAMALSFVRFQMGEDGLGGSVSWCLDGQHVMNRTAGGERR